jgi:hypothetical protein
MRVVIGWILEQIFSHREDRGLRKYMRGEFQSLEEMGIWNRYGMNHDQFDDFHEKCTQKAIERYSNYLAFFDMLGIQFQSKKSLSTYYYYTEFYKRIWFSLYSQ